MGTILMLLGISLLSFFNCRNSTVGMIKEIGVNSRYYPQRYTVIPRWMKKLFRIKQSKIPKYLYAELIMAIIFALLGLVNSIVACCVNFDKQTVGILVIAHCCLIIFNAMFFVSMSFFFKKKR